MHKKIVCFDFDKTLVNTAEPDTGIPIWEMKTGLTWPTKGWWSNPESLNLNILDQPLNRWVYQHYLRERSQPNSYVFCATGRILKLKLEVQKILDYHGIVMDDLFCNTGGDTFNFKRRLFDDILRNNPKCSEFTMYDDRQEHLDRFVEWAETKPLKINIIDTLNKKQIF